MSKKYLHLITLAICCFAVDSLKPSSVEALSKCLDLRDNCETPPGYKLTKWIYGPPPYCYVWKGEKGEDENAYKTCVSEGSAYSCRQACFIAKNDGKCTGTCEYTKETSE